MTAPGPVPPAPRRWTGRRARVGMALAWATLLLARAEVLPPADGYHGIWYANQATRDEWVYKYSGGLATYPQQHAPIAIYRPEVHRTFFVLGGTTARAARDRQELLHLVAWFDHARGTVSRPRILLNKKTEDAHDNPILAMDPAGRLWVFSPSHGTSRPSYLHRSVRPYDITEFERVFEGNFSYPQAWWLPSGRLLLIHTRYGGAGLGVKAARCVGWMTRDPAHDWSPPSALAAIEMGNYSISWAEGDHVGVAFDFHPPPLGLNARANLYYVETRDGGTTWTTAAGQPAELPAQHRAHPACVYDSVRDGRLVYLKDLVFDAGGHPIVLFLTSRGHEPGPRNDPREWRTLRWTGTAWENRRLTTSDNNYDHGSLYVEPEGTWRVIAPTDPGPQPYNPGGEMVLWTSRDQGASWTRVRTLTRDSPRNHTYARRPLNAHAGFYALWADGNPREPSVSRIYFTDRDGTAVWQLPTAMEGDDARPEVVWPRGPGR